MGNKSITGIKAAFVLYLVINTGPQIAGQATMPEVLATGTLKEQMDYIEDKTRIYEDYRAIREDMFQKIKKNAVDSLNAAYENIYRLQNRSRGLNLSIDSLNSTLGSVREDLEKMTKTRNSINFLGIEINKNAYNSVVWMLVAVLAGALGIGYLAYRRNHIVTTHTRKEFDELKKEFEAYRKASREAREKMSMAHFNELKKLRGG